MECSQVVAFPNGNQKLGSSHEGSQVGFAVYSKGKMRISGQALCAGGQSPMFSDGVHQEDAMGVLCEGPAGGYSGGSTNGSVPLDATSRTSHVLVTWLVLIIPIFIASFYRTAFSKALDFAGIHANCFLFGVLPPAMAWIHRSRRRYRLPESKEDLLPGGDVVLMILFAIAVILGFWH
ncbi:putative tyrosine-specific transport protein 2 [Cocos nucifera]|uniref:Putative tyrosine-specific transport protein 2 n=1 Tax=Cocos nucifera TaxID=13894 RepID=A0A8K0I5I1_COCNU|nr:putative tyrosine-specific transport protein 2 [Cocos nucifera]